MITFKLDGDETRFVNLTEELCFDLSEEKVDDNYSRKIGHVLRNLGLLQAKAEEPVVKAIVFDLKRTRLLLDPWNNELPAPLIIPKRKPAKKEATA